MPKKIIVTGAAGNLGAAVVKKLLEDGFEIEAGISPNDSPEPITKEKVRTTQVDLLNEPDSAKFVERAFENGEIAGAVLTVGGFAMGGILDATAEDMLKMFRLNFETAFNAVKPIIAKLEEQGKGGQIVLIGTRPAFTPAEGKDMAAYSLSKSLIFRLSEIINAEYSGKGIRSHVITPATMDTPQNRKSMPGADFSKWVPLERVADVISFLFTQTGLMLNDAVIKIYNKS